jgi:hypothetical protein
MTENLQAQGSTNLIWVQMISQEGKIPREKKKNMTNTQMILKM